MSDEKDPAGMTPGEQLAYMGTDAKRWAEEFAKVHANLSEKLGRGWRPDEHWLVGWFASAIETGRSAGRTLTDEQKSEIDRIVHETGGFTSACWENLEGAGVFQSTAAHVACSKATTEIVRTVQGYVL